MKHRKYSKLIITYFLFIVCFLIFHQGCGSPLGSNGSSQYNSLSSQSVKYHPGHYYQPKGGDKSVNGHIMKQAYDELYQTPALAGIMLTLRWHEVESEKDNYSLGFAIIDAHLQKLKSANDKSKRLIILFSTKSSNVSEQLAPDYLTNPSNPDYNPSYQGGIYPWGNTVAGTDASDQKGNATKLWLPSVRERLILLMKALGQRYNSHSHFEGIGLNETATGEGIGFTITDEIRAQHLQNYLIVQKNMRSFFPNTMTFQYTNYPNKMLEDFIGTLTEMKTGLGGPDVWLDDQGVNALPGTYTAPGVYWYYPRVSGTIPLSPHIMTGNYENTCAAANCRANPPVRELLDFARDKLKANYLFWTRATENDKYKEVLDMLNSLTNANDPAVKLDDRCPSTFAPCIRD